MKRPRMIITALALAFTLAMGGRAGAQDFSVGLPVDLNNMPPEITAVILQCVAICQNTNMIPGFQGRSLGADTISSTNDPEQTFLGQEATVGTGRQVRAINPDTGEFHETVTVNFSSDAQHAPNNVGAYACWMKLRDIEGTEAYPNDANVPNYFRSAGSTIAGINSTVLSALSFVTTGTFNNPAMEQIGRADACVQ